MPRRPLVAALLSFTVVACSPGANNPPEPRDPLCEGVETGASIELIDGGRDFKEAAAYTLVPTAGGGDFTVSLVFGEPNPFKLVCPNTPLRSWLSVTFSPPDAGLVPLRIAYKGNYIAYSSVAIDGGVLRSSINTGLLFQDGAVRLTADGGFSGRVDADLFDANGQVQGHVWASFCAQHCAHESWMPQR